MDTMISVEALLLRIEELEARLEESEQLIEAIKEGEVDAFAVNTDSHPEIYTLQSGDFAYRVLIEEFGEGALNLTEDGLIVYTNSYLCELINIPYEKVLSSYIYDLIHDDSKEKFGSLFTDALKGRSKGEVNLYVNGKSIPVYVSLATLKPKLDTVGMIVSDLTEKKRNEQKLIQANEQLAQSNAELASFTYVASHDLQEPLRKIETFCNRIMEKESENFSDSTKDYFRRIISASTRMKNLIHALLDYSQTNTGEIAFIPTDLNQIIDEVRNNLGEVVDDSKAVIETNNLPVLDVIPLQFSQLFLNIMANAIKYRKQGVDPVIEISAVLVQRAEIPAESGLNLEQCWKITVSDNGIGFEQQYADQIFELFQRLHGKAEYEGTGIGLAICKKIVQNHKGFIRARGLPGVGSVFEIYLPQNRG